MYSSWPPAYTIRRSKRARQILLKISPQYGLEVVVPHHYKQQQFIPNLLAEHRVWIERQLLKVSQHLQQIYELPTKINLTAINQCVAIDYISAAGQVKIIEQADNKLILIGDYSNPKPCGELLKGWLFKQAQQHLPNLLETYSKSCGLPYNRVAVKRQKTRWGSCSVKKSINLNYQLLLLPPEITRYVMVHELCHTKELNHSAKFWQLVAGFDCNWQMHRSQLRAYKQLLPGWVLA